MSKDVERFTAGSQVLWGYGYGEWVRYSDYEQLQSRLAQVEQERDALRREAEQSERYQARMLNSKGGPR